MAAISNLFPQYDTRTFDGNLVLADTQTVTANATLTAVTVSSAAKIIDLGTGQMRGDIVVDISTVDATTGDELSMLLVQGSASATFASTSHRNLAVKLFGDSTKIGEGVDNLGDGRFVIPFTNVIEGTIYRYLRLAVLQTGTSCSIIINQAWLAPRL